VKDFDCGSLYWMHFSGIVLVLFMEQANVNTEKACFRWLDVIVTLAFLFLWVPSFLSSDKNQQHSWKKKKLKLKIADLMKIFWSWRLTIKKRFWRLRFFNDGLKIRQFDLEVLFGSVVKFYMRVWSSDDLCRYRGHWDPLGGLDRPDRWQL